ncbi:uncharacterized protein LOC116308732 [Actinia tenebrosa]|uniref:Uncharacterized protein LOC116308732 n=1 Tax=Actinia tenebrosa TaxID=6105 RepID=A0A6P8J5S4_ACTTE|nr:uncharacterized protein LOC116308732 [Actinia tenebrosa]
MPARFSKTPEIYTTVPTQPKERKPGQLSQEQLQQYFDEGYVLVTKFFTDEELQPVIEAINALVDEVAERLYKAGKITNKHEDASFNDRLTLLEKEFPGAAILVHKIGFMPKAFQDLWSNERLLNVVEQMIGPDIAGHPVWNLRTKVPKNNQVTVPWHQDNAYLSDEANETLMATAWIPFVDANKVNGCMEVGKGGHKKGFLAKHYCCSGPTLYVELKEEDMVKDLDVDMEKDIVLCEVPFGGVLFINNMVPHRSLMNNSNIIRWSVDLRWCNPDKPNGYYDLKESVLMRTSKDPNLKIDWDKFNTDRHALEAGKKEGEKEDDLEPIIIGPWMGRWELVHHNKHTQRFLENENKIKSAIKD